MAIYNCKGFQAVKFSNKDLLRSRNEINYPQNKICLINPKSKKLQREIVCLIATCLRVT